MRLTALTLNNYGSFQSERIAFSARPGTLNLLMAPNGGGKSVLRAAFGDLLFGIHGQSPMGFRFGYPGMRIMAEAIDAAGTAFSFGRRKGQGNTLIDGAGAALDPATIAQRLGAVDRTQLERLFALDTDLLRKGRDDLLDSGGAFGAALVSGAGGARDLRALRRKLEESRDAQAPLRRVAARPFYAALDDYVGARKRKDAALLRPDRWKKMQQELDAARQTQQAQNAAAHAASAEIARLERIRRVRPILHALDAAAAWLDAHPDAPVLDAGLRPRLDTLRGQIVIAEQRLLREQEQAAALATGRDAIIVDDVLLAEADAIDGLVQAAGAARKAQADLPNVAGRADSLLAAIGDRLRDLGLALPPERAGEALPQRTAVTNTRRLIKAGQMRQAAVKTAAAEVVRLADDLGRTQAEMAGREAPADVSTLDACLRALRAEGDPVRLQREAARRCHQAAAELEAALARAPGWAGTAAELQHVAVLSPDAYQRHAEALQQAQALAGRRQEEAEMARKARDAERDALARLEGGGAVADDAALATARRHRDQGWHLIYRTAFSPDPPTADDVARFTSGQPLPLAYQHAVVAADTVADQRMQDAETVGRIEAAKATLRDAEARLDAADALHREAMAARQAAAASWTEACRALPLGAEPAAKEVLAFLTARDRVIELAKGLGVAETERGDLAAAHAAAAARLAALLAAEASDLATLLPRAEARLDSAQEEAKAHVALKTRLEGAERALAQARTAHAQAEAEREAWRVEWDAALRALGRPAGEDPDVTDEVLTGLDALGQALREQASLTERVTGMRRDLARFAQDAASLAERVAPGLDPADPLALVSALRLRLQAAREAFQQRTLLAEQARAVEDKAVVERQRLAAMQDELRALLTLIGAADIEDALLRLQLAAERATQAAAQADAQARLAEDGDLLPLDTLRADVGAVAPDEVGRLVQDASDRRQAAQLAAQEAAATVAELTQLLNAAEDATEAVDAAADQQAAVARISRVLEDALLHHVAAEMLDTALEAVEQQTEPEMLQRITALFAALTAGAYERVQTEPDGERTRLILVQRGDMPDKRQGVEDLSEGTRDQLYLALRLAAVEAHVAAAPPLPFIGDDILQTFDDDRALAALRVLRKVSETTQVILLTHHRHVLDLAGRLPDGSVHVCRAAATLEAA